ncbi:hypothetical protein [Haloarcula salinisoli]|uniref:Uncharacterized protein n=1 Tax=Haloarcula salinisoli TaxID=2487746 RepID=A0A8J8CBV5_9EURY|nr:hypothetical protein [Halomicroarcula salinisoli]MBX0302785.1 hypothetical protein [Halomicroarcula salinisoli]
MGNEGGPGPVGGTGNGSGEEIADTEQSAAPADVPTAADQSKTSTCATCWQEIPPDSVRCPHCVTPDGDCRDDAAQWSYDRVVLAVVPADGARSARASAVTAFSRARTLVSGPEFSHGEVTLWGEFETSPPTTLTEGWPTLPGAVPLASTAGRSLFETAATRCEATEPTDPTIYCEDGTAVADGDDVATLSAVIEDAEVSYWVVPGVVKRYAMPEEPDAFGDPLYCARCDAVTEHDVSDQRADAPDQPGRLWACRVCGTERYGPE